MIKTILDFVCPSRLRVTALEDTISYVIAADETKRIRIQRLEDTIANKKTVLATTVNKMAVTSHAVHRYKERHNGKGTSEEIFKMLYKCMLQQLATLDTLPDGEYDLRKNVKGVIVDNTLVTILPKRDIGSPKLR